MARLTYEKRESLPGKSFVFRKARKYPIEDEAHGRSALQRVSQFGSSEEKATVRAAVKRKFPGIAQSKGKARNFLRRS